MGASNSNANTNTVTSVPAGSLLTQPGFRVKVTRDGKELTAGGAVMDPVEKAYQRGKEEGHAAIHKALDSVAAQVYDNIHEQLLNIQKQNLEKSEQMVSCQNHPLDLDTLPWESTYYSPSPSLICLCSMFFSAICS